LDYVAYKMCQCAVLLKDKKLIGDEIANVNFLFDDIAHALQNTIDFA